MYQYNDSDKTLVAERVHEFREQAERFHAGKIADDVFRPLRLMNGIYLQTHAPLLRIAIPYGLLASRQLRKLADIADKYDRGWGHFSTRQNFQFNWIPLEQLPDAIAELAEVDMNTIQTSGNCIRNVTSDHLAGIVEGEICDPRPYCEIVRQWATLHPEFAYLPRKFKIAITAATDDDRTATLLNDIGLYVVRNDAGELGFKVFVGGGLGRTPIIGKCVREFLPELDLLSYLEAILRVYNLTGRRDAQAKYKSRIKITLKETGLEEFTRLIEQEWQQIKDGPLKLTADKINTMAAFFKPPAYDTSAAQDQTLEQQLNDNQSFKRWYERNVKSHKVSGYRAVFISLKVHGKAPGDITREQLNQVADLGDQFSFGLIRSTHDQNLILSDVSQVDLYPLWQQLTAFQLATPNIDTLTDMIVCPGLDFCSLANAESISVAKEIQQHFDDMDYLYDLGDIQLNISGCMNGCAHQSVGHIGILGVDKKGAEWYQVTLGGSSRYDAALGKRLGPAVARDEIVGTIVKIIELFVELREPDELFLATVRRVGIQPFKDKIYGCS